MDFASGGLQQVTRVIQLAVAPIFLLSAVATTLSVLVARLGRVVDRGRTLETLAGARAEELNRLERRAKLIYMAISLGVLAALFVCWLMTIAFVGELAGIPISRPVAYLFIAALFSYTCTLLCLLREVFLAISSFNLGIRTPPPAS